jgi:hypothetical protein
MTWLEVSLHGSTNKTVNYLKVYFLTMVFVLGCPRVLVLPKEKPVFCVVVAWPNGLLKRLVVCWFCWPNRPPGFVPNPVVPFRKKKKRKEKNKYLTLSNNQTKVCVIYYLYYPTFHEGLSSTPNTLSITLHLFANPPSVRTRLDFYSNTVTPETLTGLNDLPLWAYSFHLFYKITYKVYVSF